MALGTPDAACDLATRLCTGSGEEQPLGKICDDELSSKGQNGLEAAPSGDALGRRQSGNISSRGSIEAVDQVSSKASEQQACARRLSGSRLDLSLLRLSYMLNTALAKLKCVHLNRAL